MGCGSSKTSSSISPGDSAMVARKKNLDKTLAGCREGAARSAQNCGIASDAFEREFTSYVTAFTDDACDLPTQTHDFGWISIALPHNGHWTIEYRRPTGIIHVAPREKLCGMHIDISMGPMLTKCDTQKYVDLFLARIGPALPKNPGYVSHELSPTRPSQIDTIVALEWDQHMTLQRSIAGLDAPELLTGRQLEIHGMHECQHYGYNISASLVQSALWKKWEKVIRMIVGSIRLGTMQQQYATLGEYWRSARPSSLTPDQEWPPCLTSLQLTSPATTKTTKTSGKSSSGADKKDTSSAEADANAVPAAASASASASDSVQ